LENQWGDGNTDWNLVNWILLLQEALHTLRAQLIDVEAHTAPLREALLATTTTMRAIAST
jgi:hypothetical protein